MRAGRKDRRIEIQVLDTSKGTFGDDVENWILFREVWAMYIPVLGKEPYGSGQFQAQAQVNFRIDYIKGISPATHRIKYDGNIYNIFSSLEIEGRKQTLEIGTLARGV